MKQDSSIGEVETWLEGIMTYKSVANTLRTHPYHTNETIKDSQQSQPK